MVLISLYLVIAPIVDNPQIEYLYSILFMLAGAVLYIPFVYMGYVFKFMDKVTTFLQVAYPSDDKIPVILYLQYNFSSCFKSPHPVV